MATNYAEWLEWQKKVIREEYILADKKKGK